jgi:hypothetical protein
VFAPACIVGDAGGEVGGVGDDPDHC